MYRSILLVPIAAFIFIASIAFASLYRWNDYKRPPISLEDALVRGKKLLGDDAHKRYCVAVELYGDEGGQGKSGAWNLYFASADGSRKHVYINMEGQGHVSSWDGPGDWSKEKKKPEPCADLADLQRRVEKLLAERQVQAEISLKDGVLLVKYRVRQFQVHPHLEKGFSEKTESVTGPQPTGIWLRATLADHPDYTRYPWPESHYWNVSRGSYVTAIKGKVLVVELRYGDDAPKHLTDSLHHLFGPHVRSPEGGFM